MTDPIPAPEELDDDEDLEVLPDDERPVLPGEPPHVPLPDEERPVPPDVEPDEV